MVFPWLNRSALLVASVSLTLQAVVLFEVSQDATLRIPIVDAGVYHEAAIRFAEGDRLIDDAFWQPPLFPLLLGCLYGLVGPNVAIARAVLAVVAVASCLLVWWIGRRLFSSAVGVVAGLMLAAYGPFLLFATRLLPTGPAVFLTLLAVALWLSCLDRSRWSRWLALGVTIGLATITVPNAIVLCPIVLCGLLVSWVRQSNRRASVIGALTLIAGCSVPIGAVLARNVLVSGDWVPVSTNGGINFYIGNNPHSDATIAIRPGEYWQRLARESFRGGASSRAEQSAYFTRRALTFASEEPLAFLRGLCRKAGRLLNSREIPRNIDPYTHRDSSRLLSVVLWRAGPFGFPFGLVVPLAVLGVFVSWLDPDPDPDRVPRAGRVGLLAFIAAYGASITLFFVSSRYRLPMAALMLPHAAAGAVWGWRRIARRVDTIRRSKFQLAAIAASLVAAVVVNLPIHAPTDGINFRAEQARCVGDAYATQGRLDEAEHHLRRALTLAPQDAGAAAALGGFLADRGQRDEALDLLRSAVSWDPRSADASVLLGRLLQDRGANSEALARWREAVSIDTTSPGAHAALADRLARGGRVDEAIEHFESAIRLTDQSGEILIRLADALLGRERYAEAIERYRQAFWKIEPDHATLNRVAWLLATCPVTELRDCGRAIEIAEHLCDVTDQRHAVALDTLAAAYAECGRWTDAVRSSRRAIALVETSGDSAAAGAFRRRLAIYEERSSAAPPGQRRSPPPERS